MSRQARLRRDIRLTRLAVEPLEERRLLAVMSFQDGVLPTADYAGTRDVSLFGAEEGVNFGDATTLRADAEQGSTGEPVWSLMKWDLSGIPATATINDVSIVVNVTNTTVAPGFNLLAMRTPWIESEATWNGPTINSTWEEPGVTDPSDFDPTVLGTMIGTATGPLTVLLNSAGRAVVAGWLADPASNHGLLISNPANDNSLRFDSREGTTATNRSVLAIDLDGDGDVDVLSASRYDDTIAWYENDGSQGFTTRVITTDPDGAGGPQQGLADGAISVYAMDVDGDGDIDVLSASDLDDKVAWYENDGSQGFTAHVITTDADGARAVFAINVDGEPGIDVLSASRTDNSIDWYENDDFENFTKHAVSQNLMENTVPDDIDLKPVELMVGRVDMRDLTFFGESETDLLRRYLDKDHAFRTGQVAVERKGRIRDNMSRSESSPGAWQMLSGFFGTAAAPTAANPDNIDVNKWTDTTWPLKAKLRSGKMAGIRSWPALSLAL